MVGTPKDFVLLILYKFGFWRSLDQIWDLYFQFPFLCFFSRLSTDLTLDITRTNWQIMTKFWRHICCIIDLESFWTLQKILHVFLFFCIHTKFCNTTFLMTWSFHLYNLSWTIEDITARHNSFFLAFNPSDISADDSLTC